MKEPVVSLLRTRAEQQQNRAGQAFARLSARSPK